MLRFLCYYTLLYGKNNTHIVKNYACSCLNLLISAKTGIFKRCYYRLVSLLFC